MTDFLLVSGISQATINELKKQSSNLFDISCNKKECIKIITYLKLIGIKNIDELLLNKFRLFLKTKEEVANMFYKCDIPNIVDAINEDYQNINLIFE